MQTTAMAAWLNSVFAGFDYAGFSLFHQLAEAGGAFLTPLFIAISLPVEKGLLAWVACLILIAFKRTRMIGLTCLCAALLAVLVNELCLKNVVCRPRPFLMSDTYYAWWQFAGGWEENSFCFASSHAGVTAAFMTALFMCKRNWITAVCAVLVTALMAVARVYLVVHYPTDVLAGVLIGVLVGVAAFYLTRAICKKLPAEWTGMRLPKHAK